MESEPSDHVLAIVKAALNLTPVGGMVASLISDYVPSSREQALRRAVEMMIAKIADIEGRIKIGAINKDDFAELYNKFRAAAARTNREEKLRTAANITANALLPADDPQRSPFDELDHLMHCVDTLSSGAIAVLGASIQARTPRHANRGDTPFNFSALHQKLPDHDPDLLFSLSSELRGLNLLHITEGVIQSSNYEAYQFRVTPLGSRFTERFIEGRM